MNRKIDELLNKRWNETVDDAGSFSEGVNQGMLRALFHTGLITDIERCGWEARFKRCPGHDPCRVWCAYCGDLCPDCDNTKDNCVCSVTAEE